MAMLALLCLYWANYHTKECVELLQHLAKDRDIRRYERELYLLELLYLDDPSCMLKQME